MRSDRRAAGALAVLLVAAGAVPVAAQAVDEDVRCFLLSTAFARQAKEENARRAGAMNSAFYLGRLSSRLSGEALAAAIRAQGAGMAATDAAPIMRACIARAAAADGKMTAAVKSAQAPR